MPDFSTALGTVSPDYGIEGLATFKGVLDPIQARGHVPAPPAGTDPTSVLRADATWGVGGTPATFVAAMVFTGSAVGGSGQTFQDDKLKLYSLAQDVQLFVNGTTKLFGAPLGVDFTLNNVTGTITVAFNLPSSASLAVDSKVVVGAGPATTYYFLDESGLSRFLDENGIDIFRTETP